MKIAHLFILILLTSTISHSQCVNYNALQLDHELFNNPALGNATTPERDKTDKPYIYLASTNAGIKVLDISLSGVTSLNNTITNIQLGGLSVINLIQHGVYLYATLGDIWSTNEESGLAIIDVTDPTSPIVLDFYSLSGTSGGAGAVFIEGDFAYLAGMQSGLIILDISDKSNITFKSQLVLQNDFPHNQTGGSGLYNARGIAIKNNTAFICYDRGGLRIVDVSNVNSPAQINQYVFTDLIDNATAYNNIEIHNNLAYITLDYYGVEILDISNPMSIIQVGWWHGTGWQTPTNDAILWSNAIGHANELALDTVCNKLYLSAGKSDIVVLDVSNISSISMCESYQSTTDDYGSWGMDLYNNKVYVAYIWATITPPHSNYTGVRELNITPCITSIYSESKSILQLYPNPVNDIVTITSSEIIKDIEIYNILGEKVKNTHSNSTFNLQLNTEEFSPGIYQFKIKTEKSIVVKKVIIK